MAETKEQQARLSRGLAVYDQLLAASGKSYFNPSQIPSTFGNYYVGSGTDTLSNFVPLPLDFMEEKAQEIDNNYNNAILNAQRENYILQAIEQKRAAANEYGKQLIGDAPERWRKELLQNPLEAKRIATEIVSLKNKIANDPTANALALEYADFAKNILPNISKGNNWNNLYDDKGIITTMGLQDTPVFVNDESAKYVTDNYIKTLKASILANTPAGKGFVEMISGNNPFTKNAIKSYATALWNDDSSQVKYILKKKRGIDTPEKMEEFVKQMLSSQMYEEPDMESTAASQGQNPNNLNSGYTPDLPIIDTLNPYPIAAAPTPLLITDSLQHEADSIKALENAQDELYNEIGHSFSSFLETPTEEPMEKLLKDEIRTVFASDPTFQKAMALGETEGWKIIGTSLNAHTIKNPRNKKLRDKVIQELIQYQSAFSGSVLAAD